MNANHNSRISNAQKGDNSMNKGLDTSYRERYSMPEGLDPNNSMRYNKKK